MKTVRALLAIASMATAGCGGLYIVETKDGGEPACLVSDDKDADACEDAGVEPDDAAPFSLDSGK